MLGSSYVDRPCINLEILRDGPLITSEHLTILEASYVKREIELALLDMEDVLMAIQPYFF